MLGNDLPSENILMVLKGGTAGQERKEPQYRGCGAGETEQRPKSGDRIAHQTAFYFLNQELPVETLAAFRFEFSDFRESLVFGRIVEEGSSSISSISRSGRI